MNDQNSQNQKPTPPVAPVQQTGGGQPLQQPNTTGTTPVGTTVQPQESTHTNTNPFQFISKGFRWWINSLTGKKPSGSTGNLVDTNSPQQTGQSVSASHPTQGGNSVANDFAFVRNVAEKFGEAMKEKTTPLIQKGVEETKEAVEVSRDIAQGNKTKKIIKYAGVGVFVLVVLFISIQIVQRFMNRESPLTNYPSEVTPTPDYTVEEVPSIYANDPVLKQLEETIGVLENEARNSSVREPALNVPPLDFAINFR